MKDGKMSVCNKEWSSVKKPMVSQGFENIRTCENSPENTDLPRGWMLMREGRTLHLFSFFFFTKEIYFQVESGTSFTKRETIR